MEETEGEFLEHLEQLRETLIRCVIYVLLGMGVMWFFRKELAALLMLPAGEILQSGGDYLMTTRPSEAFGLSLHLALLGGVIIAFPAVLWDVWEFVSPGLTSRERRYVGYCLPIAMVLFVVGVGFAYFVLPVGLRFLYGFAQDWELSSHWTIGAYLSLVLWTCLAIGFAFELPVVAAVLAALGVVSSDFLASKRKHAIIGVLIVVAIITPTTDIITMGAVSVPLIFLYEAGILVARRIERGQARG